MCIFDSAIEKKEIIKKICWQDKGDGSTFVRHRVHKANVPRGTKTYLRERGENI